MRRKVVVCVNMSGNRSEVESKQKARLCDTLSQGKQTQVKCGAQLSVTFSNSI